jgi:hypothetical protein
MLSRRFQLVALLIVAALLSASQCYAMCAAAACAIASPGASQCHHHPDKGNHSSDACRQHSRTDFLSPEGMTDLAKLAQLAFMGILALPASGPFTAIEAGPTLIVLQAFQHHTPPARSVLARLSSFRI